MLVIEMHYFPVVTLYCFFLRPFRMKPWGEILYLVTLLTAALDTIDKLLVTDDLRVA